MTTRPRPTSHQEVVAIRFGLFYEHQLPRPWGEGQELELYRDALDQVEIADRVGFDYVWAVEHHFLEEYSHSSAPEVFLGAASQRTKRIRLGHGIVQLPPAVNHPARIAERIATLDLVSGGRVDFGTGEASSSAELGGFGVRRADKRAQWQDAIDAVTRMFVEEPDPGRTDVWQEFLRRRDSRGLSREEIIAGAETLNVNIGSLRGAVGTPDQVIELIKRYESVGVDQISFVLQAGPNRHEHICESLELFGKAVLPHFTEGREEREAAKAERLAPAIEAVLARRDPPRTAPPGYRIDEDAEVARAHRASRTRRPLRDDLRDAARRRFRQGFYRLVHGRSDAQIERRFGPAAQRAFFAGMARAYDPSASGGFTGELEFRLTRAGGQTTTWTVRVGRARARQGPAQDPSLTLTVATADFLRILAGDANPASLLMDGRLRLRGDVELAPRLSEMFGGPSPY